MTHSLEVQVSQDAQGKRIDKYLAEDLKLFPRSQYETRNCEILLGSKPQKPGVKLKGTELLTISWEDLPEISYEGEDLPLEVLYQDSQVVVLNKSRGMVVHPAQGNHQGTLVQALLHHYPELKVAFPQEPLRPGIVHRLDKETTGVLIAAKDPKTLEFLGQQFRKKTTRKVYWAVVKGRPPQASGEIQGFLIRDVKDRKKFMMHETQGKTSQSLYRVLGSKDNYTLVELSPLTGRTHQLRVHMAFLGCPILGDLVYGNKDKKMPQAPLMLHAKVLEIRLPNTEITQSFKADLPQDFTSTLRTLGLDSYACEY